ncbi:MULTISPECIES: phosphatase PAP2 family protein [Mycobacterium ulcerans group]|nr:MULTISPECIES: phosphatase PAP2 family protein [Mycobacterium ulcerans group]
MTRPRMTLPLLLALAAIVVYALMWIGYRQDWGWLHAMDWSLLNASHDIGVKHPGWVNFWFAVSFVLGPITTRIVGLVAITIALVQRKMRMALLLLACVPLNWIVTMIAKGLADRPRPVTKLVAAHSASFPSGHALELTASVLAMLTFLLPRIRVHWMRILAVVVGALSVLLVGISRVALNVHHPSDVIAGWALGYVYFLFWLWVLRPVPVAEQEPAELVSAG